ncbi:MAG: putative oar protein [Chlorobi bacterium]|nr:putative oar protein [Chlorobiota bacterium]
MLRAISILLFITSFSFLPAIAQDTTGIVSGRVTTADGKPLAGASVVVLGTMPLRGAVVRPDGSYLIARVRPGDYEVRVQAVGFKAERKTCVHVSGGAVADVRFSLAYSEVSIDVNIISACRYPYALIRSTGTKHIIASFNLDPSELVDVARDR